MDESSVVEYEIISPILATKWITERRFIWQMRFLTMQELCRQAREKGLAFSTSGRDLGFSTLDRTVQHLWQLALLRADYVISRCQLTIEGLTLVHQDDGGNYIYADRRESVRKAEGFGGVMRGLPDVAPSTHLIFHPFRYYVLCEIEEMLQMTIGTAG